MLHLENFKIVCIENGFPRLITHLVFYPLFLGVMLLNCLREAIMWWIVAVILFCIFMAVIGALVTICFTGYRGYTIYSARFDDNEKKNEQKEGGEESHFYPSAHSQQEEEKFEGGAHQAYDYYGQNAASESPNKDGSDIEFNPSPPRKNSAEHRKPFRSADNY